MKHISMKTVMVLALGGMMVVSQTPAYAQLGGLLKKKSADSGGATIDKDTFGKSAHQAVENLLAARIAFLDAKAKMMDALGVKSESVAKASEALRAKEGSTSDKVKKLETTSKTTADADKEFEAKMAESKELSAESKAKFAEGGGKFIEGVILEKDQIETIQKLVQEGQSLVQSAGLLEKAGVLSIVKPVTTMSTMVPGDVKEGSSTLSKIMKFAKSQNVEIPGADKATDKLGGL
jgi:ABC-type transporter Mla subunit MlaD